MRLEIKDDEVHIIVDVNKVLRLLSDYEAKEKTEVEERKVASDEVEFPEWNSLSSLFDQDGVDLFEARDNVGGEIQDQRKGAALVGQFVGWLEKNKFSEGEFLRWLVQQTEVAGWPLCRPVVNYHETGKPSFLKMAYRYFTYWKSAQDSIAKEYRAYVLKMAKEVLDGEEV